jgi:hypothetical protein
MFGWLGRSWKKLLGRRRLLRQTNAQAFRDLSRELRDLAEVAARVWPETPSFQKKIQNIRDEMDQLDDLTSKPEFRMLSLKKRLDLRDSLIMSKTQLMDTVSTAAPPTSLPQ